MKQTFISDFYRIAKHSLITKAIADLYNSDIRPFSSTTLSKETQPPRPKRKL